MEFSKEPIVFVGCYEYGGEFTKALTSQEFSSPTCEIIKDIKFLSMDPWEHTCEHSSFYWCSSVWS